MISTQRRPIPWRSLLAVGVVGLTIAACLAHRAAPIVSHEGVFPANAAWMPPDQPNQHVLTGSGKELLVPPFTTTLQGHHGTLTNGTSVELVAISAVQTHNPDHAWGPWGGPLAENPFGSNLSIPDMPATQDGKVRHLYFRIKNEPPDSSILGYVPDGARADIPAKERPFHGWDVSYPYANNQYQSLHEATVYVDSPKAHRYLFGIASGPFMKLGVFTNRIGAYPYAETTLFDKDGIKVVLHATPAPKGMWATAKTAMPTAEVEVQSKYASQAYEFRLVGYGKDGKAIPLRTIQGECYLNRIELTRITSFEIQARMVNYLQFAHVSFDPDSDLWRGTVWGNQPPGKAVKLGSLTVSLAATSTTRPGIEEWQKSQYVSAQRFTASGSIWRDTPVNIQERLVLPLYSQDASQSNEMLPKPIALMLNLHDENKGQLAARTRITVYGSSSGQPGKQVHRNWNQWPTDWVDPNGELLPINLDWWVMGFSPVPSARYAQIKIEAASGDWIKGLEFTPNLTGIRPAPWPRDHDYRLSIGRQITENLYDGKGWKTVSTGSAPEMDSEIRLMAKLKNGKETEVTLTSYVIHGPSEDRSRGYDFWIEKPRDFGPKNAFSVSDIAKFRVEYRPIRTGWIVVDTAMMQQ